MLVNRLRVASLTWSPNSLPGQLGPGLRPAAAVAQRPPQPGLLIEHPEDGEQLAAEGPRDGCRGYRLGQPLPRLGQRGPAGASHVADLAWSASGVASSAGRLLEALDEPLDDAALPGHVLQRLTDHPAGQVHGHGTHVGAQRLQRQLRSVSIC